MAKKKKISGNKSHSDHTFEKLPGKGDTKIIPDADVEDMLKKVKQLTYGQCLIVKRAVSERFAMVKFGK